HVDTYLKSCTHLANGHHTHLVARAPLSSESNKNHHLPVKIDRWYGDRLQMVRGDAPPPFFPRRGVANNRAYRVLETGVLLMEQVGEGIENRRGRSGSGLRSRLQRRQTSGTPRRGSRAPYSGAATGP